MACECSVCNSSFISVASYLYCGKADRVEIRGRHWALKVRWKHSIVVRDYAAFDCYSCFRPSCRTKGCQSPLLLEFPLCLLFIHVFRFFHDYQTRGPFLDSRTAQTVKCRRYGRDIRQIPRRCPHSRLGRLRNITKPTRINVYLLDVYDLQGWQQLRSLCCAVPIALDHSCSYSCNLQNVQIS